MTMVTSVAYMDEVLKHDLITRHKCERKELQGRIIAAKNAVKNDKKKKNKVLQEAALWEAELDQKHEQELAQFTLSSTPAPSADDSLSETVASVSVDPAEEGSCEASQPKLNKAQRRREKKEQEARERNERIHLAERDARHGPGATERRDIVRQLRGRGLALHEVAPNGDCFYKAVAHQLSVLVSGKGEESVASLRDKTASVIEQEWDNFEGFLLSEDSNDSVDSEVYCANLRSTKVWAGHPEIIAICRALHCRIEVIQSPESTSTFGEDSSAQPLVLTYHRHAYKLGEHYNSTRPYDQGDEESNEWTEETSEQ